MALATPVVEELRGVVGPERLLLGPAELVAYSYDATFQQQLPAAVAAVRSVDEIAAVLRVAHRESIPVVTRGAATSLAGGAVPAPDSLVLNLAGMNRIIEIDTANAVATVEAGVVNAALQAAVEAVGLFYPPDPASLRQCTIGGNVACNAGGPRCLKYGTTRDYVLGMTAVLADGRVLRLGGRTVKNATGYALHQLLVGSEGTLAVIAEVILKLLPLPRHRATAAVFFAELDAAAQAVAAIIAAGILPAALELLDGTTLRLVDQYAGLGLPRGVDAMLIVEQDGTAAPQARADVDRIVALCRELGATDVRVAESDEERAEIWRARQATGGAVGLLGPHKLSEDVVVPRDRVPELIRRIRAIAAQSGLAIPIWGHAGDGNLHPAIMFDRSQPGELERVERAAAAIFQAALSLGGRLSGEHGVGSLKREFLEDALGPETVSLMRALKAMLDPKGLLNPHKVFPQMPGGSPDHAGFLTRLPVLGSTGASGP